MNHVIRKTATVVAALTVSLGIMSVAAPAHADTSWGYVRTPGLGR